MAATWTVPKREVPADVLLPGSPLVRLRLFLGENAETHSGFERPSDLLNGQESFLPAVDSRGELVMLNRDCLMVVTVAADHEFGSDSPTLTELAPEETTRALVDVMMEDGSTLRGLLTYLLPAAQRRLQDFLNLREQFLTIQDDKVVRLVNKRRITRVTPV